MFISTFPVYFFYCDVPLIFSVFRIDFALNSNFKKLGKAPNNIKLRSLFDGEIFRIRMMDNDRIGGLLGLEHEFFRQMHTDLFGLKQFE